MRIVCEESDGLLVCSLSSGWRSGDKGICHVSRNSAAFAALVEITNSHTERASVSALCLPVFQRHRSVGKEPHLPLFKRLWSGLLL